MGDAADDAFDAAMRAEADRESFWAMVWAGCEQSPPYPCAMTAAADEEECDLRCAVCGKEFWVDF